MIEEAGHYAEISRYIHLNPVRAGLAKRLLDGRAPDKATPALAKLRDRPSLDRVTAVAAGAFGGDPRSWRPGRRCGDIGRAAAAYLARARFGHPSTAVAEALGYSSSSSVTKAIERMESRLAAHAKALRRIERKLSADR